MRFARHCRHLFLLLAGAAAMPAAVGFERGDWALRGQFPLEPKRDEFRAPSPQGFVVSERFFVEDGGEAFMLVKSTYPIAFTNHAREALYETVKNESITARAGEVTLDERFHLGDYGGRRFVIEHRRARRTKDLRLVLIGATLYASSYERPARQPEGPRAREFLGGLALQSPFADARKIEETERWRELGEGPFKLRYDATRWYRDPTDAEPGIFNLLRMDKLAEAQLITERATHPGDLAESVIAAAREAADSLRVLKRGTKLRSGVNVQDLEFAARVEGTTYVNHGYFYSGPEGAVQLRAWAPEGDYRGVDGDISELLDGLNVVR